MKIHKCIFAALALRMFHVKHVIYNRFIFLGAFCGFFYFMIRLNNCNS